METLNKASLELKNFFFYNQKFLMNKLEDKVVKRLISFKQLFFSFYLKRIIKKIKKKCF